MGALLVVLLVHVSVAASADGSAGCLGSLRLLVLMLMLILFWLLLLLLVVVVVVLLQLGLRL